MIHLQIQVDSYMCACIYTDFAVCEDILKVLYDLRKAQMHKGKAAKKGV